MRRLHKHFCSICFLISLLFYTSCSYAAVKKADANKSAVIAVESVQILERTLHDKVSAQGEIKAYKNVVLQSDIPGKVISLHLPEGKQVQAGQTIIKLEQGIYQAALKQAKARHGHSKIKYERIKKLQSRGTGSASEVEDALASLQFDEGGVELAQVNLAKTEIKAPFTGVLGLKDVDVGDYINPGQPLVELVDISQLLVDFYLPERYLSKLKQGIVVQLITDALPNQTFEGRVYAIAPTLDPALRALHVRALFSNKDFQLKPGLYSKLNIIFDIYNNALVLPEDALVFQNSQFYVYKIVDDKVALVAVDLGIRESGYVEIKKGLEKGDKVVLSGQVKLYDGAQIIEIQ